MAKFLVTLSINVDVEGVQAVPDIDHAPIVEAIAKLGAAVQSQRPDPTPEGDKGPNEHTAEPSMEGRILAVLADKSKFKRRTFEGLKKAIGFDYLREEVGELIAALSSLIVKGLVTKASGKNSNLWYYSLPKAPQTPEASLEDRIVQFLSDKSKYTKRSLNAIGKKFPDVDEGDIQEALDNLLGDERIHVTTSDLFYV